MWEFISSSVDKGREQVKSLHTKTDVLSVNDLPAKNGYSERDSS